MSIYFGLDKPAITSTTLDQRHQQPDIARNMTAIALAALTLLIMLSACSLPHAPTTAMANVVERPLRARATAAAPTATAAPIATIAPAAAEAPTATPPPAAHTLSIGTVPNEWQFAPAEVTVAAGDDIALTFTNNAKNGKHNWVLVRGGDDVAAQVNTRGADAGEASGYIPTHPSIIAHTAGLIAGRASETMTFAALTPGAYTYLCTVPGHYDEGMRGVLTVK
jgi:plastocyanin